MDPTLASLQGQHLPLQQVHSWLFQGHLIWLLLLVFTRELMSTLGLLRSSPH